MSNTAPTLDTSLNLSLGTIADTISDASNSGITITELINNLITDADGDVGAIAITEVDNANGTWQYSLDGGVNWTALTNVSASNAVVLGAAPLYAAGVNGGTPRPGEQDWLNLGRFTTASLLNQAIVAGGTETSTDAGTTLDTTRDGNDNDSYAGYANYAVDFATRTYTLENSGFPDLNPSEGFQISFEAQVLSNTFTNNDRAVFSILAVAADGQTAIELGFQRTGTGQGRIFAQSDDRTPNPGGEPLTLFTSAEEVSFDTTSALVRYTLDVTATAYSLKANGTEILTGPLRNYTNFVPPSFLGFTAPNPYTVANLLFLGDNSTSAGGSFTLGDVSLQTETRVRFVPNANFGGPSNFSFRAWDGSDASAPGSRVNATVTGGITPFSTELETASITVTTTATPTPDPVFYNFSAANYTVREGNETRTVDTVVLTRTGNTAIASTVTVTLGPGTPNPAALDDYSTRTVSLSFAAGETQKVVPIEVLGDRTFEPSEQIALSLTNPGPNSFLGTQTTATLTLRNDDPLLGNSRNNTLTGNDERNIIKGLGRDDVLVGLGGNDVLIGGGGRDTLNGGIGADIQRGKGGSDRFRFQGGSMLAAHRNSLVSAPDRITDFIWRQGDRIELDYDNRANTPNRPRALFNAGNQTAGSLQNAALAAFADKNQAAGGRQALRAREAVFFNWRNQTYLAVNDNQARFAPNRDLVINMTGIQFRPGDATAGVLGVVNYFA